MDSAPGAGGRPFTTRPAARGWAVFRLDALGRVIAIDDGCPPLLPRLPGDRVDGLLSRVGKPELQRLLEALRRGEPSPLLEVDLDEPGGETVSVRVVLRCARREDGNLAVIEGIAWDASEEREEQDLFRALTHSSPVGIYVVQDGRFVFVNEQMSRFTGYSTGELLAMRAAEMVHEDDRETVRRKAIAMLKGEDTTPYEYRSLSRHGAIRWVLESVASVQHRGRRATLGNYMDVTRMKRLEEHLAHNANRDPLTGLPNRTVLASRLDEALERPGPLSVLFIDLDDFKVVNDEYGHAFGDKLLQIVGSRMARAVRPGDLVARVGGDEFVIVTDATNEADLAAVAERIITAVSAPCRIGDATLAVGASIGIAVGRGRNEGADRLLARADAAMYRAKAGGPGGYAVDGPPAPKVA